MAHYAFLNENNVVTEVIVGVDENELIEGLDPETWYGNLRQQLCKRTSFNTSANTHLSGGEPFRFNYAGIGYTYDEHWDAFIPPRPFPSWKLDYQRFVWEPPVAVPDRIEGFLWRWSEVNKGWISIPIEE